MSAHVNTEFYAATYRSGIQTLLNECFLMRGVMVRKNGGPDWIAELSPRRLVIGDVVGFCREWTNTRSIIEEGTSRLARR
jgi:hypothetical protein